MEIIYRASDGSEFNDKKECKLYEKNLEKKISQTIDSSMSFSCSSCGKNDTRVLISERSFSWVRRRRQCVNCPKKAFTTYEIPLVEFIKYDKEGLYDLVKNKKKRSKKIGLCIYCGFDDVRAVVRAVESKEYLGKHRRKRCTKCNREFSTLEVRFRK